MAGKSLFKFPSCFLPNVTQSSFDFSSVVDDHRSKYHQRFYCTLVLHIFVLEKSFSLDSFILMLEECDVLYMGTWAGWHSSVSNVLLWTDYPKQNTCQRYQHAFIQRLTEECTLTKHTHTTHTHTTNSPSLTNTVLLVNTYSTCTFLIYASYLIEPWIILLTQNSLKTWGQGSMPTEVNSSS